jgi:hypothetical protein
VKAVAAQPLLLSLLVASLFLELASRMTSVLYAIYLVDDIGFEPGVLGLIFAIGGATSLVGAWIASRAWVLGRLGIAMPVALFIRAAGTLCMPLAAAVSPAGYLFLVANQLVTDPAWMFYEIHETSLRQRITDDALLGRVNATMRFAGFGAALAGTGLAALIGELADARTGLFTAVAITAVGGVVLALSPLGRMGRGPKVVVEAAH